MLCEVLRLAGQLLFLIGPNRKHQGACERRQHCLRHDAEEVGTEGLIDQSAGQEQPRSTDACHLARGHKRVSSVLHSFPSSVAQTGRAYPRDLTAAGPLGFTL